jgi:thiol-disulfide isomerase/thioredoxin
MKYLLILAIAACMSLTSNAQKAYSTSKDEETGATIFKGPVTMADLQDEPTFTWLKKGDSTYQPDSTAIKYLKKELPAYTIVVLMGTWCDDSQYLIPKLGKTLTLAKFPMKQYVMYGVDRAKETGGIESQMYKVKRVPTIILYKDQREVGRIVESVTRNIETDIAQIIQKSSGNN